MATQITKTNSSKSNNNNTQSSTTQIRDVGLTGDDFVQTAQMLLELQAMNRRLDAESFQSVLDFQNEGLKRITAAGQSTLQTVITNANPNDPRQYLPFVAIGSAVLLVGAVMVRRGRRRNAA